MASYFQRYIKGECVAVWDELMALGESVREAPLYSDAWAVAKETMRRVRYNLALVAPRLRALGYVFLHDPLPQTHQLPRYIREWIDTNPPLFTNPPADITHQLETFEQ